MYSLRHALILCALAAVLATFLLWRDKRADARVHSQVKEICGQVHIDQRIEDVMATVDRQGGRFSVSGGRDRGVIFASNHRGYSCECLIKFNQEAVSDVSDLTCRPGRIRRRFLL